MQLSHMFPAALVAVALLSTQAHAATDPVTAVVTANEKKVLHALETGNLKAFRALTVAEGWSLDGSGLMSMKDFYAMIPDLKGVSFKSGPMTVVKLGRDAVLVTYKEEDTGSYKGHPFPPVTYVSTTWVNRGGKWLAIFHQESPASGH